VLMRGADQGTVDDGRHIFFERSLSLEDARSSDALLAYAMNGEPLPLQHGFPLRLIVPGWYAVTSVKWLAALELIETPFRGFFQGDRYVYEWERDGETTIEPVRLQQVRSIIAEPGEGASVPSGDLVVRGLAWSGAAPISHVDVRLGTGPWQRANLLGDRRFGRWQWWEIVVQVPDGGAFELRARATDLAGRTQPDTVAWNRLGYGGNAIQVVNVSAA
jgi:DMSO/TMAO reductase YedYZ molybdopterin-dependent catalytic subunit